jgi:serine/threonine protein kinase/tetratricopeptide (TPR) repeat protein
MGALVTGSDYEIVRTLGSGGMGRVYHARIRSTGAEVALKTLVRAGDPAARRMLLGEATIAAQLAHENVVRLLDVGADAEGNLFLVMELVVGFDLDQWLAVFPGARAVLDTLAQVADGLAVAHAAGIIHGDLKPANVLVERATARAKITDFGIAHVVDPLTPSAPLHRFAGTPFYMAPEQYFGDDAVGPWTDLYALGVMLYEMLAGQPPITGANVAELFQKKILGVPPFQARTGVRTTPELEELLRELLEPAPRRRLRFAADAARRLREIAAQIPEVPIAEITAPPSKRPTTVIPSTGFEETQLGPSESNPRVVFAQTELAPASTPAVGVPSRRGTGPKTDVMDRPSLLESSRGSAPNFARPEGTGAEVSLSLDGRRAVPFVGRTREVQMLEDLVAHVSEERRPRVLVLLGGAGVGKSRLARHALAHVERTGAMESAAAAFDVSETSVTGGLRHAFRRLLGWPVRLGAEVRTSWDWLSDAQGKLPFDAARMEAWLGRAEPMAERDIVELAERALSAASKHHPIYLWFDDAGWSRDGALALVEALLEKNELPVLCTLTLRTGTADHPALRERLGRLAQREQVRFEHLGLLAPAERRTLLEAVAPLEPALLEALARMDETPLLLVQTVRDWIESGTLELEAGTYRPAGGRPPALLLATRSPARVFAQRLDALVAAFGDASATAERILLRIALLGARFRAGTIVACAAADAPTVDAVLDRALLAGILRLDRDALRFDHGLFQEALLERLAERTDAAELRSDVARGLLSAYGAERSDVQVRAAALYRDAGDRDAAAATLAIAARAMLRAGAFDGATEAIATLERWREADGVPEQHARTAMLHRLRGLNHYFHLRYEEARGEYEQALPIFEALGDLAGVRDVRFNVSSTYFYQDHFRDAEAIVRRIVATEPDDGSDGTAHLLTMAHHRLADLAGMRGDPAAMLHHADEAARYGIRSEPWVRPFTRVARAEAALALGDVPTAQAIARELSDAVDENGDGAVSNDLVELRLKIDLATGNWRAARTATDLRLEAVLAQGDKWRKTMLLTFAAMCATALDDRAAAAEAVTAFVAAWDEVKHDEAFTWWAMDRLAKLLEEKGLPDEATLVRGRLVTRKEEVKRKFA